MTDVIFQSNQNKSYTTRIPKLIKRDWNMLQNAKYILGGDIIYYTTTPQRTLTVTKVLQAVSNGFTQNPNRRLQKCKKLMTCTYTRNSERNLFNPWTMPH